MTTTHTTEVEETVERESGADESLAEEFEEVVRATRDDGFIDAEVTSVVPVDAERIEVEFRLPNGRKVRERMRRPVEATDDYKFVRICRKQGIRIDMYDDLLIGETLPTEQTDDGEWTIHAPAETTIRERLYDRISLESLSGSRNNGKITKFDASDFVITFILYPLLNIILFPALLLDPQGIREEYRHFALGVLASGLWIGGALLLLLVFLLI